MEHDLTSLLVSFSEQMGRSPPTECTVQSTRLMPQSFHWWDCYDFLLVGRCPCTSQSQLLTLVWNDGFRSRHWWWFCQEHSVDCFELDNMHERESHIYGHRLVHDSHDWNVQLCCILSNFQAPVLLNESANIINVVIWVDERGLSKYGSSFRSTYLN
jgi:hypothetical protein